MKGKCPRKDIAKYFFWCISLSCVQLLVCQEALKYELFLKTGLYLLVYDLYKYLVLNI